MATCRAAAMPRAIALIQRVCDIAAPRNYLAETREYLLNAGICRGSRDTTPQLCIAG